MGGTWVEQSRVAVISVLQHKMQAADAVMLERNVAHICVAANEVVRLRVDGDGVRYDSAFENLGDVGVVE